MQIGNRFFDIENKTYIMGILNITPDSFSDGGRYHFLDKALYRVEEMVKEGADIIDVGGESTRPGYTKISKEEEIDRVLPILEAIKKRFSVPVSLDTYKSEVAEAGIEVGIDLINDIWGLQYDKKMAEVIAESKAACCLMHNRKEPVYSDFLEDVTSDIMRITENALKAGIEKDKIMIDPGIGFAKSTSQNLEIIRNLSIIKKLGYPVLLGVSRKSVIGNILEVPVEQRLNGTLAVNIYGCIHGCSFLRVHDVKEHKEVLRMIEAIQMADRR